ncbi:uncharacterized protein LOC108908869 [Anoplophora glabripennis]|uniref:uncharacterized protein LOC108908869 n=1 Tax=Anoplophora glabripennis TaxID=217634 RepID=UPI000873BAA9|nr:uncharacterized protein LOC108908869 [Anoplophora glabripennis]
MPTVKNGKTFGSAEMKVKARGSNSGCAPTKPNEIRDLVGRTEHHVKNAGDFVDKIRGIELQPEVILVSFDVTSIFTKVPVDEALEELHRRLIAEDKDESLMDLAKVCLLPSGTISTNRRREQQWVQLSPVLANIHMEAFEKKALESTTLKPKCWYRYVEDTFIIWQHRREFPGSHQWDTSRYPVYHGSREKNSALSFLDVLVERKPDGTLRHRVYRKTTHTDRYLNAESHHH